MRHKTKWNGLETVESAALALQRIDNIKSGHSFPTRMFGVSDRVTNHILKEVTEDTSHLFVDVTTDPFDTTTSSKATDGWLRNALDVFSHDLPMTFCATFAASGHEK
jgi:hypothetical protein